MLDKGQALLHYRPSQPCLLKLQPLGTCRHFLLGALFLPWKTSFFFTLPQRQTNTSVPGKITPLRKTFHSLLLKVCGRNRSWTIILELLLLQFSLLTCSSLTGIPRNVFSQTEPKSQRSHRTNYETIRFGCRIIGGVFGSQIIRVRLRL